MKFRVKLVTLSAFILLSANLSAKTVNEKDAESIAKNFLITNGLPVKELVPVHITSQNTAMRAPAVDRKTAAYHLFTDAEHKSLVVISGDDIARPVLGYSFNIGNDVDGNIPPAMKDWLDDIERQIIQAREKGLTQNTQVGQLSLPYSSVNVIKQLKTAQWGQNYPFNSQCPLTSDLQQCITGCVATSYAILMKYYGFPDRGTGTTPAYVTSKNRIHVAPRDLEHQYNWNSMPMVIDNNTSLQQVTNISQLMSDIGTAIQADYGTNETSALYNKGAIYKHFGYHVGNMTQRADYTWDEWYSMLKNELDNNQPVLYNAKQADESGAHSFILDGYAENNYFCVNWGWTGNCNGVYALNALVTDNGYYDYNGPQAAFFDFQIADGLPTVAIVNDSIECPSVDAAVGLATYDYQPTRITLVQNTVINEVYVKNSQNVILDLNGQSVGVYKYGLFNYGQLTVTDSQEGGKITMNTGNTSIIDNYGDLTLEKVEYTNKNPYSGNQTDFRRCVWTAESSVTRIKSGKFLSGGQAVCVNGKLIIDSGEYESIGDNDVILNACLTDTVTINGGTFKNDVAGTYCRAVWTADGTTTHIKGGLFTSNKTVICTNGEMIIDNGQIRCAGNAVAIANYSKTGKLTINNGTVRNISRASSSPDYRRAIWTDQNTMTHITGGLFYSDNQTLTFSGEAVIDGGTIENTGTGTACLSWGNVTVNNCKMKANTLLYVAAGATLVCYGGIYSKIVDKSFLGKGCLCEQNTDSATRSSYPYKIVNPLGIEEIKQQPAQFDIQYDLNGIIRSDNNSGVHIIRNAEGKTIKVLYK